MNGFDIESAGSLPIEQMNAGLDLQDTLQTLPESDRERGAAIALEVAAAVTQALELSPEIALSGIKMALVRETDVVQRTALVLIDRAVRAICGDDKSRASLERVAAFLQNAAGPESNTLKIREVAREVQIAVTVVQPTDPSAPRYDVAAMLLEFLRTRFDPMIDERIKKTDLEDWLSRYAKHGAIGKLTLAGIVARIIRGGHLAGAREHHPPSDVLKRVDKALKSQG